MCSLKFTCAWVWAYIHFQEVLVKWQLHGPPIHKLPFQATLVKFKNRFVFNSVYIQTSEFHNLVWEVHMCLSMSIHTSIFSISKVIISKIGKSKYWIWRLMIRSKLCAYNPKRLTARTPTKLNTHSTCTHTRHQVTKGKTESDRAKVDELWAWNLCIFDYVCWVHILVIVNDIQWDF